LNVQYFYVRINSEQIKHTWHDVCDVRDNYPKKAYLLEAWEECLAPNARALARTILTLCAPLDDGETPGSLEVTPPQGHGFGQTFAGPQTVVDPA